MPESVRVLSQQTVLITGAANGLGRALASAFGSELGLECVESEVRVYSIAPGILIHTRMSEKSYTPD